MNARSRSIRIALSIPVCYRKGRLELLLYERGRDALTIRLYHLLYCRIRTCRVRHGTVSEQSYPAHFEQRGRLESIDSGARTARWFREAWRLGCRRCKTWSVRPHCGGVCGPRCAGRLQTSAYAVHLHEPNTAFDEEHAVRPASRPGT